MTTAKTDEFCQAGIGSEGSVEQQRVGRARGGALGAGRAGAAGEPGRAAPLELRERGLLADADVVLAAMRR